MLLKKYLRTYLTNSFVLILFIIIFSCKTNQSSIEGTYHSIKPSFFSLFKGQRSYIKGVTIVLKNNNRFFFNNCSGSIKGRWVLYDKKIRLYYDTILDNKNNILNIYNDKESLKHSETYILKDNRLSKVFVIDNNAIKLVLKKE